MSDAIGECARTLPDEAATLALGASIASGLQPGWIITLRGELGSGKTTLARGLLHALGFTGRVKSPTYTLVENYHLSGLDLLHFDLYRFADPREWLDAGFNELLNGRTICIIEWPERIAHLTSAAQLDFELTYQGNGRYVRIRGKQEALQCVNR